MSICARPETPRGGVLVKRKEREYASSSERRGAPPLAARSQQPRPAHHVWLLKPLPPPLPKGASSFKLMAGYLAHEFLRFGTLLGERPEASGSKDTAEAHAGPAPAPDPRTRYAEASVLLMAGGARVPGVVNPSQLGHWLRIEE
ncbi:hypothetical protein GUJ93_ZPchr0006g44706 [Zizania palustris]|uniref:Uncharacterized protein n=1 Tax=Zizania palustris TaxID=103762 RepID=A0A8J5W2V2_ZIZPA|nr:hypothetical protein GUJ93_ZPchr0006g44706 [Zizania palustris]KAG8071479.1 hypothetical protein GUJ93_ZPchr0006g44706 [Zizania palustris]